MPLLFSRGWSPQGGAVKRLAQRVEQAPRLGVPGLTREDGLQLAARGIHVLRLDVRVGEREMRVDLIVAPDRNLQLVDGVRHLPLAQVDTPEQEVRLALVRREVDGAPKLADGFRVALCLEQAAAALDVKRRLLALVALLCRRNRLLDARRARDVELGLYEFEAGPNPDRSGLH